MIAASETCNQAKALLTNTLAIPGHEFLEKVISVATTYRAINFRE